jgi:uncharacterized protein YdcH (DUF465 family)
MTRKEWLSKKHRELDYQVSQLEAERNLNRDVVHKALLVDLKKQRLAVRTEILSLEANEQSSVN